MSMPAAADLPEVFDPATHGEKAAAVYREKRPLYADFARCLKNLLEEALQSSDVKTQSVEARAKTIDSYARKAGQAFPLDPTCHDVVMIRREQYQRLERHLRAAGRPRIEMTFAELAQVIGEQLPPSAYQHPAWWGSDPKHTQAVWLDAG